MKYGYARSAVESSALQKQVERLKSYGVDDLYVESISAYSQDKLINQIIENANSGDEIVVTSIGRLSRDIKEIAHIQNILYERNVKLTVLDMIG